MNMEAEILLVEDNPCNAELSIRALKKNNLADHLIRLGVDSYIVNPVDFDKFIEPVRNIGFYWLLINQQSDIKTLIK
jgi:hypothetical protein